MSCAARLRMVCLLLAVALLAGCVFPAAAGSAAPQHQIIIVLLDETGSFVDYWRPAVDLASKVAGRLKPGDAFAVIGIDDHGNDPDDALVPLTILDPGSLTSLGTRRVLAKKVKALERRNPRKPYTDILGSIQQAAIFADSPALQGYQPVLLFFSDMQQTPHLPAPKDIKGWKFAMRGEAYCFYVNVTDWVDHSGNKNATTWDAMVGSWAAVLNAAGLDADPKKSFFQSGDSAVQITRLFPAGF